MSCEDIDFRPARPEDAPDLARLIDAAGEGLPKWLWSRAAEPGQSPETVGVERARRNTGGFSWRHACVLAHADAVIAILLDYRIDDPYALPDLSEVPEPVQPLLHLESLVPGAWYINALAVDPGFRRKALGRTLMMIAEARARAAECARMALIVAEQNHNAVRLYDRLGYRELARRSIVPWPGCPHAGDYLLMARSLS